MGWLPDVRPPLTAPKIAVVTPQEPNALTGNMFTAQRYARIFRGLGYRVQIQPTDAREPEAYAAGHIPGAVNVEPQASSELLKGLPQNSLLVVYCDGPECGASARLAARLLETGPVAVLPDGFPAWAAAGYPVIP